MSTAVATLPSVPSDDEIEGIRRTGKQLTAYAKEVGKLNRIIEGLSWGNVTGASLSPATRYALAEFCRVTRANPITHVDMFANKPFLNASYWSDLVNQHDYFHRYEQRDISVTAETALRERATKYRSASSEAKALELEDQADEIATARQKWSPRPTATVVIETTIYRFMNAAPMDAIKAGTVTDFERYLISVTECNWAGGMGQTMAASKKYDPIGDANPGTTARTRSLRRAAVKAFSAWMEPYEAQLHKAEEIIEAEFTIVREDARAAAAALPSGDGPQAVRSGHGEPQAAAPVGAQELPMEQRAQEALGPKQPAPAPPFDQKDAQGKLFATFKDSGIVGDARKVWMKENGLGDTTKAWTPEQWGQALALQDADLVEPVRVAVRAKAEDLGVDLGALSRDVIQKDFPAFLIDWKKLAAKLQEIEDDV